MSIKLKHNDPPNLKLPEMNCDICLAKKLDKFELTQCLNRTFSCGVIGRPGSGKTSLIESFLRTPALFNKVFSKIYVFIPKTSLSSIKDSVFSDLPEDQIYTQLNAENIAELKRNAEESSKKKKFTLAVFDDVQQYLKVNGTERMFTELVVNRRHLRLCLFVVAQTYKKIPRACRMCLSDFFLFNVSKEDLKVVHSEVVDVDEHQWVQILNLYKEKRKEDTHLFLYIHCPARRIFCGFDEVLIDDDESQFNSSDESDGDSSDSGSPNRKKARRDERGGVDGKDV